MKKIFGLVMALAVSASALAFTPKEVDYTRFVEHDNVKAEVMVRSVLQQHPDSAKAHLALSEILREEKKFEAANTELEIAKKLDPNVSLKEQVAVAQVQSSVQVAGQPVYMQAPVQHTPVFVVVLYILLAVFMLACVSYWIFWPEPVVYASGGYVQARTEDLPLFGETSDTRYAPAQHVRTQTPQERFPITPAPLAPTRVVREQVYPTPVVVPMYGSTGLAEAAMLNNAIVQAEIATELAMGAAYEAPYYDAPIVRESYAAPVESYSPSVSSSDWGGSDYSSSSSDWSSSSSDSGSWGGSDW